jgi:cell division inhibitor SepF
MVSGAVNYREESAVVKDRFRGFMVFLGLAEDDYDDFGRSTGVERPFVDAPAFEQPEPEWSNAPAPSSSSLPPRPFAPQRTEAIPRVGTLGQTPAQRPMVRPLQPQSVRPITTLAQADDVIIFQPMSYDESKKIADQLKARRPIVINLVGIDADLKRRLLDFTSGVVYTLSGSIKVITPHVYIAIPQNFHVNPETYDRLRRQFSSARDL